MGSFTFVSAVLVLLFLSPSFFFILPCYGVSQDILRAICSQTQNQEICKRILDGDTRTSSADLPLLSIISLDIAMKQANKSYNTFSQLHGKSTNPTLKSSFNNCVGFYHQIQDIIKQAHNLSMKRQYKKITQLGEMATLAYKCENGLPLSSSTGGVTRDMLLVSQIAASVNLYVSRYVNLF